jgi:hypothetical protein
MKVKVTVAYGPWAERLKNPLPVTQDLASKVREDAAPFVPYRDGGLASQVTFLTQALTVSVVYGVRYAHYIFTGKAMGGKAPKHYTGTSLNYFTGKHSQAGADWIGRAVSANASGWGEFVAGRIVNG